MKKHDEKMKKYDETGPGDVTESVRKQYVYQNTKLTKMEPTYYEKSKLASNQT